MDLDLKTMNELNATNKTQTKELAINVDQSKRVNDCNRKD